MEFLHFCPGSDGWGLSEWSVSMGTAADREEWSQIEAVVTVSVCVCKCAWVCKCVCVCVCVCMLPCKSSLLILLSSISPSFPLLSHPPPPLLSLTPHPSPLTFHRFSTALFEAVEQSNDAIQITGHNSIILVSSSTHGHVMKHTTNHFHDDWSIQIYYYYINITIVQSYTGNITSLLPSVLLQARSTSNNANKWY